MKVLILGVAAVQADAISILKEMGHETYAIAMKNDGPGAELADHFEEINIIDVPKVKKYIVENSIDVVYSTGSDLAMPVVSQVSSELGLPYFVSEKTAKTCNNKDLMRQVLGKKFEGNIPFQILESKTEKIELNYPFIMKPTDSQGQRGVNLIKTHQEFIDEFDSTKAFSRTGKVIIEYYVEGPEISVNGYMVNGELRYITPSDRQTWPQYTGLIHKHIVPANTIDKNSYNKLKKIMNNAAKKLKIDNGPVYAQIKVENGNPYIIEITPRLDGCHMWNILEKYEGINLMKLTFNHLLEDDTSELQSLQEPDTNYVLEFICEEPNTEADYSTALPLVEKSVESYFYYNDGDLIRPVNGKYEKIGYGIYREEQ